MDWHILLTLPLLGLVGTGYRGMKVGGKVVGGKMSGKQLRQVAALRASIAGDKRQMSADKIGAQSRLRRIFNGADKRTTSSTKNI